MKYQSMYTNTSSVKAIAGLLFVTFATGVVALYTPEIVDGIIKLAKTGREKAEQMLHKGKQQYAVAFRSYDGTIRDTGKRIWR